jgi:hypothetical protein
MLGIDPEFGASVLRLWVAAGSAALLILFCVLALFQPQLRVASSPARRTGFVLAGAVLGGVMAWAFLDHGLWGGASAERRAFETRAQQLNAILAHRHLRTAPGRRHRRGAGAIAPLARNRPLRLCRPRTCGPRRLHWPELQDARAFPRREPRACQPERRDPRSVCRALRSDLGCGIRWANLRGRAGSADGDGFDQRAGSAQGGQYRLSQRRLHPSGEHHES